MARLVAYQTIDVTEDMAPSPLASIAAPVLKDDGTASVLLLQAGTLEWLQSPDDVELTRLEGSFTGVYRDTTDLGGTIHNLINYDGPHSQELYYELTELNYGLDSYLVSVVTSRNRMVSKLLVNDDSIQGSTSGDTLLGYQGNDTLVGSAADSTLDGGDVMLGNDGSDVIYGFYGDDSIVGGSALVDAADLADTLDGGAGNDHIYGSAGADLIYGGTGNDLLVGGADNDIIYGGAGNDIFVNVLGGGYDVIYDFTQGDILTVERTTTVYDYASFIAVAIGDANGSFVRLGDNSGITLAGVQITDIGAEDLYFYG